LIFPPDRVPLFFTYFPSLSILFKSHDHGSSSPVISPVAPAAIHFWDGLDEE